MMRKTCVISGLLALWVMLAGCHTDPQIQSPAPTITPAVTIIYVQPHPDVTNTYSPQAAATLTAFAPHYTLLQPGETLSRVWVNVDNFYEEPRFSLNGSEPVLQTLDLGGAVVQSRWQILLDMVYGHQIRCVFDAYVGDIIECHDYRVRVINIFDEYTPAVVAWSRVDTPLTPLSRNQIKTIYDELLPAYDLSEMGVILPAETEITYNDSLSLFASQFGTEEVSDSYIMEGFHKRWRFNLAVTYADTQFERVVYAGDILEFDGYRIRVHYVDNEFVYLTISLSDNTD